MSGSGQGSLEVGERVHGRWKWLLAIVIAITSLSEAEWINRSLQESCRASRAGRAMAAPLQKHGQTFAKRTEPYSLHVLASLTILLWLTLRTAAQSAAIHSPLSLPRPVAKFLGSEQRSSFVEPSDRGAGRLYGGPGRSGPSGEPARPACARQGDESCVQVAQHLLLSSRGPCAAPVQPPQAASVELLLGRIPARLRADCAA